MTFYFFCFSHLQHNILCIILYTSGLWYFVSLTIFPLLQIMCHEIFMYLYLNLFRNGSERVRRPISGEKEVEKRSSLSQVLWHTSFFFRLKKVVRRKVSLLRGSIHYEWSQILFPWVLSLLPILLPLFLLLSLSLSVSFNRIDRP